MNPRQPPPLSSRCIARVIYASYVSSDVAGVRPRIVPRYVARDVILLNMLDRSKRESASFVALRSRRHVSSEQAATTTESSRRRDATRRNRDRLGSPWIALSLRLSAPAFYRFRERRINFPDVTCPTRDIASHLASRARVSRKLAARRFCFDLRPASRE